jgi:hypothetical protein
VALPVLAVLPAVSRSWRWFWISLAGLAIGAVLFLQCAIVDLNTATRGEGPAVFGIAFYLAAVFLVFVASLAVRVVLLGVSKMNRHYAASGQK